MKFGKDDKENDRLSITDIFENNMDDPNEAENTDNISDDFKAFFEENADAEEETEAESKNLIFGEELFEEEIDDEESQADLKKKEKKEKKKKKKKSGRALKIAFVALLVLVVGFGTAIGMGLTVVNNKLDTITKVQVDREALCIDPQVAKDLKGYRNIALLGIDSRNVKDDSNSRSDAMIIASIEKSTGEIRLLSIYRDTYLNLGYGLDKLTHAYASGGATQTLQSINRNMDLNCEEVMVVNWKTVADTVDALGGLDIKVKQIEINEMNKYIIDTQKNIGGSKKLIKKAGKQTLNGNQAVTYARIRKDVIDGDYRRNERMEIVISKAFEKATQLSVSEINAITDEILPQVKTNMTTSQLMEMLMGINQYKMGLNDSWPYETQGWTHDGIWYGPPISLERNVSKMHEKFFNQKDYKPTETVKNISTDISEITGLW